MMEIKNTPKNANIFYCEKCHFTCSKKSDWDRHIITRKHKLEMIGNKINANIYKCNNCCKEFKTNSGLWKHEKKCSTTLVTDTTNLQTNIAKTIDNNDTIQKMIEVIMTKNQEFITELVSTITNSNKEVLQKMTEIMPKISNQTTCNTSNTTNNNHFSINVFLNDQCKDAMNITDFVHNIQCQIEDLENIGQLGYVNGISKIFIDNLSNLAITKRPLHCTDVKRKSMYIKKDNEWKKDDKNEEVRKAINQVANKNIQNIEGWRVKNMDQTGNSVTGGTAKRQQYLAIVGESLEPDDDGKKSEKILKNVGDAVLLDKNVIESVAIDNVNLFK